MNREKNFEAVQSATIPLPVAGKDMNSILKSLETGVENIFTGDKYAQYLQTMSKFHRYSFNNTLLIAMQRPDATLVTGYRNWQSMGRQVKKGEKRNYDPCPCPDQEKKGTGNSGSEPYASSGCRWEAKNRGSRSGHSAV